MEIYFHGCGLKIFEHEDRNILTLEADCTPKFPFLDHGFFMSPVPSHPITYMYASHICIYTLYPMNDPIAMPFPSPMPLSPLMSVYFANDPMRNRKVQIMNYM